jgi:hypothetical protein
MSADNLNMYQLMESLKDPTYRLPADASNIQPSYKLGKSLRAVLDVGLPMQFAFERFLREKTGNHSVDLHWFSEEPEPYMQYFAEYPAPLRDAVMALSLAQGQNSFLKVAEQFSIKHFLTDNRKEDPRIFDVDITQTAYDYNIRGVNIEQNWNNFLNRKGELEILLEQLVQKLTLAANWFNENREKIGLGEFQFLHSKDEQFSLKEESVIDALKKAKFLYEQVSGYSRRS